MHFKNRTLIFIVLGTTIFSWNCGKNKNEAKYAKWAVVGGTKENIKYSSLTQIDTNNVKHLQVAWIYRSEHNNNKNFNVIECNPIIIGGTLYGTSPTLKLFALNAATGKEKWIFNPDDSVENPYWHRSSTNFNRGVAYWSDGKDERIIFAAGSIVYEVDANTGKLITSFGKGGGIDLVKGLGMDPDELYVAVTSPVMVYKNLFLVGGLVAENTPGFIRAFDVKTGKQKWIFHTIPHPGEKGYESWEDTTAYKWMGSTNSWGGFSLDEKRGILYAPTGSPTNDFYGGLRKGDNLFGSSLLALDAETGKLLWYFQNVHHDVWDKDLPTAPALITLRNNGKEIPAAVQTTKTGFVFVFNRVTGDTIYPIKEKPVPTEDAVPGEQLSPTQPYPVYTEPFSRQQLTKDDLNHLLGDSVYQNIKKRFETYVYKGTFTPPTVEGTIAFPGTDGGGDWAGGAVDPETNVLYINSNEMAFVLNLVKSPNNKKQGLTNLQAGKIIYEMNCMRCHGTDRQGSGDFPSLIGVGNKLTFNQFNQLLTTGRKMMPGFNELKEKERKALASFILDIKSEQKKRYKEPDHDLNKKLDYGFTGYNKFLTKEGWPAINPPWGQLTAIDLNTGKKVWQIPLGNYSELQKKGDPPTGTENYGGPVVTAGGLVFIAATVDGKFRAFNKRTGELLFETELPAAGSATPAVYAIDGKEYIVIACGGSKSGIHPGRKSDTYVAFSLRSTNRISTKN
jgi:quinoprotein glucose dehydrogenase